VLVNDPGFVRVRHATRTIVSVAISLVCLHPLGNPLLALFGAFATAAFMQANSGVTIRQRMLVMSAMGAGTSLLVFAGGFCHGHRVAAEIFLIVAAAICFWARHYVPDRNLFTLYAFVLAVLAETDSGPWPQPLWIGLVVLSGLPIAFVVYFYIWPPSFPRRFAIAVRSFLTLTARHMNGIVTSLERRRRWPNNEKDVASLRATLAATDTLTARMKGAAVGQAADRVVRLMRRVVVCFELLEESVEAASQRELNDLARAVAAIENAFREARASFLTGPPATEPRASASGQVAELDPESLRDTVAQDFKSIPDHARDARAAAALIEAGLLAARLQELRVKIAIALRDPAFNEAR